MIVDGDCFCCGNLIRLEDVIVNCEDVFYREGWYKYTRIKCPKCNEQHAYVISTGNVYYECTWSDSPCGQSDCEFCLTSNDKKYNSNYSRDEDGRR